MRKQYSELVEKSRVVKGEWASKPGELCGAFVIARPEGVLLRIIANNAYSLAARGWEHVSVSTLTRVPTWEEMCFVKDLFWDEEECVVQFHPPKSDYVNYHPYCLHMWRHVRKEFPRPPSIFVGPKDKTP